MFANISRRTFVAGAAALPFIRSARAATRTPGVLTFGLSSYPPSIQPWQNTGTPHVKRVLVPPSSRRAKQHLVMWRAL